MRLFAVGEEDAARAVHAQKDGAAQASCEPEQTDGAVEVVARERVGVANDVVLGRQAGRGRRGEAEAKAW